MIEYSRSFQEIFEGDRDFEFLTLFLTRFLNDIRCVLI